MAVVHVSCLSSEGVIPSHYRDIPVLHRGQGGTYRGLILSSHPRWAE